MFKKILISILKCMLNNLNHLGPTRKSNPERKVLRSNSEILLLTKSNAVQGSSAPPPQKSNNEKKNFFHL